MKNGFSGYHKDESGLNNKNGSDNPLTDVSKFNFMTYARFVGAFFYCHLSIRLIALALKAPFAMIRHLYRRPDYRPRAD